LDPVIPGIRDVKQAFQAEVDVVRPDVRVRPLAAPSRLCHRLAIAQRQDVVARGVGDEDQAVGARDDPLRRAHAVRPGLDQPPGGPRELEGRDAVVASVSDQETAVQSEGDVVRAVQRVPADRC
jgi:hypothetical protein